MMSLGFIIVIQERTGSYSDAGLIWTGFSIAFAIGVPVTGRIADRRGSRVVLVGCLSGYTPALVIVVIALFAHAPLALLFPVTAVLGLCTPPAGPLIRGSWADVVPPDRLRSAYALDAVVTEVAFIGGPLLVSALIAVAVPQAAVVLAGLLMVGGCSLLLAAPSMARRAATKGSARHRRDLLGSLRQQGLRVLFLVTAFDLLGYGCMIVGITAAVTHDHARSALGVVLSVFSVGVVVGGLGYGSRRWPGSPRLQLSLLYGGAALILAVTSLGVGVALLGALLVCAGLLGGPRDTLQQLLVGDIAAPEYRTEAFAWLSTIMWVSYGLGTALGGRLASLSGGDGSVALRAAALGGGCAAICALRVRSAANAGPEADPRPRPAGEPSGGQASTRPESMNPDLDI
jgi:MFS family permease